ncbi:hypothetical protein M758_UG281300 [Ceratodon purpureus]|nr:hypothetical protein M758_UG281300 [Ceratodon purpureus]
MLQQILSIGCIKFRTLRLNRLHTLRDWSPKLCSICQRLSKLEIIAHARARRAAALAQRKYYEKYLDRKAWTLESVDEWMSTAVKRVESHLQGELRKHLPVADLKHTPAFTKQIKLLFMRSTMINPRFNKRNCRC